MPSQSVIDGEWIRLENPLYIACCDCGLTHIVKFRRDKKGKMYWSAIRDNRRTSQFRRYRYRQYICKRLYE